MNRLNFGFRSIVCAALLSVAAVLANAQQFGFTPPAPVPSAILAAKKVFISNAGADKSLFPHPFSGGPNRAYDELYAALKAAGQFELVADPAGADLVLELTLTAHNWPNGGYDLPTFQLVVYAPKTHFVLWVLTESIPNIGGQKFHDNGFDNTLSALLRDFENLAGKPLSAPADLPTEPSNR